jgi:hypothetical protein
MANGWRIAGAAAVVLGMVGSAGAQGYGYGHGAPVPVPSGSGFSVLMPYRGGYVNVPLSPSGEPLVPGDGGQYSVPVPSGVPAPPAPGEWSRRSGSGYQVIDPLASTPEPPPSGSGFFVVPRQ